ncbi:unnamed protein product, partial [Mesorhabditis belari]|uniref:Uncharacterized protein n=1 Tax=Mesorhabditis belari TaxID=2138241 RepID=A0AAF3EKA5_9BILA
MTTTLPPCLCSNVILAPPFGAVPNNTPNACNVVTGLVGCISMNTYAKKDQDVMHYWLYDENGNVVFDSGDYCSGDVYRVATTCDCRTLVIPGNTINSIYCLGIKTPYWNCTNSGLIGKTCAAFG